MRILSVTEHWPKLKDPSWTTFRLPRRDKDWQVGEVVQVVYRTRSPRREVLGIAKIVKKELYHLPITVKEGKLISKGEAIEDGFFDDLDMRRWFIKTHGTRVFKEPLNKLTVEWIGEHHE